MAEVKEKRKGQYFIACGSCEQSTFGLTKEEANRTTCPRCGSTKIIIDRG